MGHTLEPFRMYDHALEAETSNRMPQKRHTLRVWLDEVDSKRAIQQCERETGSTGARTNIQPVVGIAKLHTRSMENQSVGEEEIQQLQLGSRGSKIDFLVPLLDETQPLQYRDLDGFLPVESRAELDHDPA